MHSYPRFCLPSVHPGHPDHSARGGSAQYTAVRDHTHHQVRVAIGGRVIEHERSDRELAGDALPEAIDF